MYATFGRAYDAHTIFSRLPEPDRISWEALISGFSQQGSSQLVKQCFEEMQKHGLCPQETTYSNILAACSHGGDVKEGPSYFNHIGEEDKGFPKSEHYNCMVDLFGRAGNLEAATEMLLSMPGTPDMIAWMTLLSACKIHGNVGLGKQCFEHATQHVPNFAAGYVLMSNIYADAEMWKDVQGLFEQRSLGAWKKLGQAWIEVENNLRRFTVGDINGPDMIDLHAFLDNANRIMKEEGYIPQVGINSETLPTSCAASEKAPALAGKAARGLEHTLKYKDILYESVWTCFLNTHNNEIQFDRAK